MKKTILILAIVLVLTFLVTMTASATKPAYIQGFFYVLNPEVDFCYATGTFPVPDGFIDGCGYYITGKEGGLGDTALWEGMVDGKSGTCIIHVRKLINNYSHVTVNQCTGGLAGLHLIATGDLNAFPFTWEGYYHWDP